MSVKDIDRQKEVLADSILHTNKEIKQFEEFVDDYKALDKRLETLPDKLVHNVLVPIGKVAFMPGQLYNTNKICVLLGDNLFAYRSAKQAREIIDRRVTHLTDQIQDLEKQKAFLEPRLAFTNELGDEVKGIDGTFEIREEYSEEEAKKIEQPTKRIAHTRKLHTQVNPNNTEAHIADHPDEYFRRLEELERQEEERGEADGSTDLVYSEARTSEQDNQTQETKASSESDNSVSSFSDSDSDGLSSCSSVIHFTHTKMAEQPASATVDTEPCTTINTPGDVGKKKKRPDKLLYDPVAARKKKPMQKNKGSNYAVADEVEERDPVSSTTAKAASSDKTSVSKFKQKRSDNDKQSNTKDRNDTKSSFNCEGKMYSDRRYDDMHETTNEVGKSITRSSTDKNPRRHHSESDANPHRKAKKQTGSVRSGHSHSGSVKQRHADEKTNDMCLNGGVENNYHETCIRRKMDSKQHTDLAATTQQSSYDTEKDCVSQPNISNCSDGQETVMNKHITKLGCSDEEQVDNQRLLSGEAQSNITGNDSHSPSNTNIANGDEDIDTGVDKDGCRTVTNEWEDVDLPEDTSNTSMNMTNESKVSHIINATSDDDYDADEEDDEQLDEFDHSVHMHSQEDDTYEEDCPDCGTMHPGLGMCLAYRYPELQRAGNETVGRTRSFAEWRRQHEKNKPPAAEQESETSDCSSYDSTAPKLPDITSCTDESDDGFSGSCPVIYTPDVQPTIFTKEQLVFFDLETTGLRSSSHILQIAAIAINSENKFNAFVTPRKKIEKHASKVNNIYFNRTTRVMTQNGREVRHVPIHVAIQGLIAFLKPYKRAVLVAHNNRLFDSKLLYLAASATSLLESLQAVVAGFVDTLPLVRHHMLHTSSHTLPAVYTALTGETFDAHDALEDVRALRTVLEKLDLKVRDIYNFSYDWETCANYAYR